MKRVTPSRRLRALEGLLSALGQLEEVMSAAEGLHGRAGSIGGQFQHGWGPANCCCQ